MTIEKPKIRSGYDPEAVRKLLEYAAGEPKRIMDVFNLARPGKALEEAQVRRSFFDKARTDRVIAAYLRRRLAKQLGRMSPRFLGPDHELTCISCQGIAVKWQGRWLCENGHGGVIND